MTIRQSAPRIDREQPDVFESYQQARDAQTHTRFRARIARLRAHLQAREVWEDFKWAAWDGVDPDKIDWLNCRGGLRRSRVVAFILLEETKEIA